MREAGNLNLHRFAVLTAFCTFLLLIAGALVTSNQAGLSIPTWPLANGSAFPPMVGGIRWEWSHRIAAGTVAILTIILAGWIWIRESRQWVRVLGVIAFLLIVAQALLGRFTVKTFLDPPVSAAHATLAEIFFITTIAVAVFTSSWWTSDITPLRDEESPKLRTLATWTSAIILVQIVLGAAFRHKAFGIIPHLIGAIVVTVMVFWVVLAVAMRFRKVKALRTPSRYLEILLGAQLILGGFAYMAVAGAKNSIQPSTSYVVITVAHVAVGALTFAASFYLTLRCFRLLAPSVAAAGAVEAPREGVAS